jgi:hypothetical protein
MKPTKQTEPITELEYDCGCGRLLYRRQSHCFCDYEWVIEGVTPTVQLIDTTYGVSA